MRRSIVVLAAVSLMGQTVIASAEAQAPSSSLVGERVRVTVRPGGPEGAPGDGAVNGSPFAPSGTVSTRVLTGQLVGIDADRLLLTDGAGAAAEIALSDVERLELSVGERRNTGRGAWIGGSIGAVVGGVAGAIAESDCEGEYLCLGAGGGGVLGAALAGATGASIGMLVGFLVKSERWTDVSSQRWGLTVRPGQGSQSAGGSRSAGVVEIAFRVGM